MSNNNLSFEEFLKKYSYKRSDEIIAYELYLVIQYLKRMLNTDEEKSSKKEDLIQKELTNVLLAKIYVAQLSLNPHINNPYVEDSLKKEMRLLDKKIRELCGDVFNE